MQRLAEPDRYQALLEVVKSGWQGLVDKPEEEPERVLRALWFRAAGRPRSVQRAAVAPLPDLDDAGLALLRRLIDSRLGGEPLAYLTGYQSFMGIEFISGPGALIPRRETELLGWTALRRLRELVSLRGEARVLDLCTGAGNLAVALALHEPLCTVEASDLSSSAIELARSNIERYGLVDRVTTRTGDLFGPYETGPTGPGFDLIVCNPPYISSANVGTLPVEISGHEPRLAFDGGPMGIQFILRLISAAPGYLRPDSWLAFEVGAGQGPFILRRLRGSEAYTDHRAITDQVGEIRVIMARTPCAAAP